MECPILKDYINKIQEMVYELDAVSMNPDVSRDDFYEIINEYSDRLSVLFEKMEVVECLYLNTGQQNQN